jgi:HAMP domain-containing protein
MFRKLKLATKFTLLLALVCLGGIVLSNVTLSGAIQHKGEDEVTAKAEILAQAMDSVRDYMDDNISPLLKERLETELKFIPEFVPDHVAREIFEKLHQRPEFSNYLYKEATLNPTNPKDKADEFETKLVEQFRSQPELTKLSGYRDIGGQKLFFIAQPLTVKKVSCLECHSRPALAPKSLLATYGDKNGFGWKFKEVVAAQTVFVPAGDVFNSGRKYMTLTMGFFVTMFAALVLLINWLLKQTVIHPIKQMTAIAHRVSNATITSEQVGEFDSPSISQVARRADEPGQLARAFQHMARIVAAHEQNLNEAVEQRNAQLAENMHELRTLLKVIIGDSEKLKEEMEDLGTPDLMPDVQKIHGVGKHVLGLIDNILDLILNKKFRLNKR